VIEFCPTCRQPLPQSPVCRCGHLRQIHNIEVKSMPCSTFTCDCGSFIQAELAKEKR
jgi:hypothetical protein